MKEHFSLALVTEVWLYVSETGCPLHQADNQLKNETKLISNVFARSQQLTGSKNREVTEHIA